MKKQKILSTMKMTDFKWVNLFQTVYKNSKGKMCEWIFASRKKDPFENASANPDAVVIVATVDTPEGRKVVVTKEYRAPIDDYEYGFPAGLIDPGMTVAQTVDKELQEETGLDVITITDYSNQVFSSAGLSDESVIIVFVEAKGEISSKYQEDTEDIETFLYDIKDVKELLSEAFVYDIYSTENSLAEDNNKKVGAKSWGVLYHYTKIGKID
jgi:ADP-ribose pyrophosphatase